MSNESVLFFLFLTGLMPAALADDSGSYAPPCPNCPDYGAWAPYPQHGLWFNPQRSGTGINIDVQNGVVAAVYYGFREDGSAVWYIFSGGLERSEADDAYWALEAELFEASGGEPVNGEYREPEQVAIGDIRIEFMQRNLMRFSIDDSPEQRMVPMKFGSHWMQPFEPVSDIQLPDFDGSEPLVWDGQAPGLTPWLVVQINPQSGSRYDYAFAFWRPHWMRARLSSNPAFGKYNMMFWDFDAFPHLGHSGDLICGIADTLAESRNSSLLRERFSGMEDPVCMVWVFTGNPPDAERIYFMPLGNISDRRFTGVSDDGWIIEGFRLMYD